MDSTPQKAINLNKSISCNLTPVRFLGSPGTNYFSSNDSNAIAVKSRLEIIFKNLQDNYAKWLMAEKRGMAICSSIETIKTRALGAQITNGNVECDTSPTTLYPSELKTYCDKLAVLVSIFEDIAKNAEQTFRQLKALLRLPGCSNEIFYRSWKITEFIYLAGLLATKYSQEAAVKSTVMRELPHCMDKAQLIRTSAAWEYPQFIDDSIKLMFKFLTKETKVE